LNKSESRTYDPVGNIDTKTDYQYDSANQMTAETNPAYLQVSYHYDDAGDDCWIASSATEPKPTMAGITVDA